VVVVVVVVRGGKLDGKFHSVRGGCWGGWFQANMK